jgi:hypothetical protein
METAIRAIITATSIRSTNKTETETATTATITEISTAVTQKIPLWGATCLGNATSHVGEESNYAKPRQSYVAVSSKETATRDLVLSTENGHNGARVVDRAREESRRELALTQGHSSEEIVVKGKAGENVTNMHVMFWYHQTFLTITRRRTKPWKAD